MFRRTIAALLSIFMLTMPFMVVSAADGIYELTFDISSGGENEITVKQGDIITVDFYMIRTDDTKSFDLRSYQNEIEYDKAFFELVKPEEWDFRYTPHPDDKVDDERTTGQKIIKITEVEVSGLNQKEWIGSFQLRVIGETGTSSTVRNSRQKAKDFNGNACVVTPVDLKVNISQYYSVTYSEEVFDETVTDKVAYEGIDYQGEILDSVYDEIYDWTVTYEIDGIVKNADISKNTFTIPGEDIVGDMKLDYSKKLNIRIYIEDYAPGKKLIRVEGAADGYTFGGKRMIKSANSEDMGAWVVEGELSLEDAEGLIGVAEQVSDTITESTDITQDGKTNLNDLAIVLGCSKGYYDSETDEDVTRYLLSDVDGDRQVTESDYEDIVNAYKQVR